MRHPVTSRTARTDLVAAACLVLAAVGFTGCGGDDAPEEAREFCSGLKTIEELDIEESGVEAFTDALVRVDDVAPEEVSEDTAVLRRFIERGAEISELPDDEQAAAIEEFGVLQSEFDAAVIAVEEYARSNCPDLEESFFGS